MLVPSGPIMVRVSIYDHAGTLQILDASADLNGGVVTYENTPDGCGSAELHLGKRYEEIYAEGYWTARNIVEISTADDVLQTSCLAGATKLYIGSKIAYDTAQGHPTGQIWLWDGSTSCARIPVTGVGTDAGGDYITVGTPLSGGGNPASIPAYAAGTYIFRRRYAGLIMQTQRPNQTAPGAVVRCAGLSTRISEAVCSFTLTTGNVDMGTAIYDLLAQFSSRWPELTISAGNFPTTGQTSFDNSYDRTQVSRVVADLLAAANSSGDTWKLVIGHDRTPRLVKVYTSSGNTYAYNVTLDVGTYYFQPRNVVNTDQDASQLYNSVEVIGDTNPATQQPYRAIVQDSTSISTYGQIDAQPVPNTACKSDAQCSQYGQALLNQQSLARSNASFEVSTRNDVAVTSPPMGLSRGDVVLGVHNVTVSGFQGSAPNVYGLVSSVVTTIEVAGDSVQQVRFSAIEPDWNADVRERANALATALHQGTATTASIASYCVSSDAFPVGGIPTSGLNLQTPAFLALFAQGSQPVAVAAHTVALTASATNWVWLASNGSWNVQTSPATQAGEILYGIFTTDASSIIGQLPKAPVGVLKVGVGNIDFGNHPAPTISPAVTLATGYTDNTVHSQVEVPALTVTNVPTDGSVSGLAYYYRLHGATGDTALKPVGELPLTSTTAASQSIGPFGFEVGAGQVIDVFVGFAGIGSADYGPTTQIGSSGQIASGFTPANLVVTTTNLANGASGSAPTLSGAPTFSAVASANGISAGVTISWTITNQPTDGSLHEILVERALDQNGTPSAYEQYVELPVQSQGSASGSYSFTALDLTNGASYWFRFRFRTTQAQPSPASTAYEYVNASVIIKNTQLTTMPNGVKSSGPNITAASLGSQRSGTSIAMQDVTVTFGDWTNGSPPTWAGSIMVELRANGSGSAVGEPTSYPFPSNPANATFTVQIPAGLAVDIGFFYVDMTGTNRSADNYPVPLGNVTGGKANAATSVQQGANLVPDSNFDHQVGSNLAYWKEGGSGIGIYAASKSPPYKYVAAIGSSLTAARYSSPIDVVNGVGVCFSCEFPIPSRTAGNAYFGIVSTADANYSGVSAATPATVYASKSNSNSFDYVTWTPTFTGQVCVCFWVVGFSGEADFQIPQLEVGSAPTNYTPGIPVSSNGGVAQAALDPSPQTSLAIAQATDGASLLDNDSFEAAAIAGSGDLVAGWYVQNNSSTSNISISADTSAPLLGSQCILMRYNGGLSIPANTTWTSVVKTRRSISVTAGDQMRARAFIEASANVVLPAGVTFQAYAFAEVDFSDGTYQRFATQVVSSITNSYSEYSTGAFTVPSAPSGKVISGVSFWLYAQLANANATATTVGAAGQLPLDVRFDVAGLFRATNLANGEAAGILPLPQHAAPVTATLTSSAGSDGSYIASGTVGNRHLLSAAVSRSKVVNGAITNGGASSNLLFNPLGYNSANGWSQGNTGGSAISLVISQYGEFSVTLTNAPVGDYGMWYQSVPAGYGYHLTFSVDVQTFSFSNAQWNIDVHGLDANNNDLGSMGIITGTGSQHVELTGLSTGNSAQAYAQVRMYLSAINGTGNGAVHFMRPQLERAQNSTQGAAPFNDAGHALQVAITHDINGNIPKTTPFNNQASMPPYTSDITMSTSSPSGQTYFTASTTAGYFYRADGSQSAQVPAGNYTSPSGLSSGTTYYVGGYVSGGAMDFTYTAYSTDTATQYAQWRQAMITDGLAVTVSNVTIPTIGGGGTGGGGGKSGCPWVDEMIERRRGGTIRLVRAGDLAVGDELRDPAEGWNPISQVWIGPSRIWTVSIEGDDEPVRVDATHRFFLASGEWCPVTMLEPGMLIHRGNGRLPARVVAAQFDHDGEMVGIKCHRERYLLRGLASHNIKVN